MSLRGVSSGLVKLGKEYSRVADTEVDAMMHMVRKRADPACCHKRSICKDLLQGTRERPWWNRREGGGGDDMLEARPGSAAY
jgi:hypothetical protein